MTEAVPPEITVLVVTFRARELLADCLESLAAQTVAHRVLVVDNASTDGTAALLAERFPQVPVLRLASNTGFAGGLAAGLAEVRTRWTALLNDDATAAPDWLERLLVAARTEPGTAALTSRMLLADGRHVNNLGVGLTRTGHGFDLGLGRPADGGFPTVTEVFGFSGGAALLTPFGGHATNLAAITAAIAAGPDAHPDPRRRYVAGLVCGAANLVAAAGAGWLVGAYSALPAPVVAVLAAVALLPALAGALGAALAEGPATSTAALVTIAVTASGVVVLGVGSAFWALLVGVATWLVLHPARRAGSASPVRAAGPQERPRASSRA